jgi:hypothetical protein
VVEEIVVGEIIGWVIVVVGKEVEGEEPAGTSGTPRFPEKQVTELFPLPKGGGEKRGLVFWLIVPDNSERRFISLIWSLLPFLLFAAVGSCSTSLGFGIRVGGREVGLYLRVQS